MLAGQKRKLGGIRAWSYISVVTSLPIADRSIFPAALLCNACNDTSFLLHRSNDHVMVSCALVRPCKMLSSLCATVAILGVTRLCKQETMVYDNSNNTKNNLSSSKQQEEVEISSL